MKALSLSFFCRPAEVVGPDLVGCRLVKRQRDCSLPWGVVVETEAYSQDDPACHGFRRRSPQNETLFGEPGRLYVYVSYGIHHCVSVVNFFSARMTSESRRLAMLWLNPRACNERSVIDLSSLCPVSRARSNPSQSLCVRGLTAPVDP